MKPPHPPAFPAVLVLLVLVPTPLFLMSLLLMPLLLMPLLPMPLVLMSLLLMSLLLMSLLLMPLFLMPLVLMSLVLSPLLPLPPDQSLPVLSGRRPPAFSGLPEPSLPLAFPALLPSPGLPPHRLLPPGSSGSRRSHPPR